MGFEPTGAERPTRSPGARTRPDYATPPRMTQFFQAEGVGFEPTGAQGPRRFRVARTRPDYATPPRYFTVPSQIAIILKSHSPAKYTDVHVRKTSAYPTQQLETADFGSKTLRRFPFESPEGDFADEAHNFSCRIYSIDKPRRKGQRS